MMAVKNSSRSWEVHVEGAAGEAGARADGVEAGLVGSLLDELGQTRFEQRPARRALALGSRAE
jgi:hypothetical protein